MMAERGIMPFREGRLNVLDFLAAQWLTLHASSAGGIYLIPGWGTKISCTTWPPKNFLIHKGNELIWNRNEIKLDIASEDISGREIKQ